QIPVLLQHPGLQEAIFFLVYAILVLICSRLYFINTTPDLNEAFFLGLVFVGVSFILDVIVTVPLFLSSYYAFFFDWEVWLSYILTLGLVVASVYLQPFIERFK
ncbi:hypothetical protein KY318_03495, partial [Candidatus Woesearchaeota archaeon]|nr:hypothetical protein [Candidatus Woesearchaeota archaeon]